MDRIRIAFVAPDGTRTEIDAPVGRSLMRVALDAGVAGIEADCGGCLSCATCHVWVDPDWAERLPPVTPDEHEMLEMTAAERRPTSRLSCEIELEASLSGLTVHLPPTQY